MVQPTLQAANPNAFRHCHRQLPNGHIYHYVDELPANPSENRGTCLLLHGFPDLWYGWRYQVAALKQAGFRCIVPSTLGYGGSSQPDDIRAYGFKAMSDDLDELLKCIGISERILLFGHDWGGVLGWRFAGYYPGRVKSIAAVSTPYAPPAQKASQWLDLEALVKTKLPNFGYQVFFASPEAQGLIECNLPAFLGFIFAEPKVHSSAASSENEDATNWTRVGVLQDKLRRQSAEGKEGVKAGKQPTNKSEVEYYLQTFRQYGLGHPLKYYQSRRVSFEEEIASGIPAQFPKDIPALFLTGDNDVALPLAMSEHSPMHFEKGQYRRKILKDADHWLLQVLSERLTAPQHWLIWIYPWQRPGHRDKATEILVDWAISTGSSRGARL